MASLNFHEFVKQHPEILVDRHGLAVDRDADPMQARSHFRGRGLVMLRNVIPQEALREARAVFGRFVTTLGRKDREGDLGGANNALAIDDGPSATWDKGEDKSGSWHTPWAVRHGDRSPTAIVLSEMIKSWAWPVIETICDSKEIVVMFGLCLARHRIDEDLPLGVHQDVTAVNPDVPLSIWIPLGEVAPKRHSGLGFIVPAPDHALPADDDNDIGMAYVLDNLDKVWVPHYQPGDLTIHSRYSPHFTTGYGTHSERYSLEIRLWAKEQHLMPYYDPSLWISRRNGVPVVVKTKCSLGIGAHGFLANAALQTMQASASPPRQSFPRAVMGALRSVVR